MGDRAMAEIRVGDGSLYFYTHWTGHRLRQQAEEALKLAKPRIGDDSYATKIVLDSLIESSGARDQQTGAGVMLNPDCEDEYNNDQPSVLIDLVVGEVTQPAAPRISERTAKGRSVMNVAELIVALQRIPNPEQTIVVQSIDSEGNSIRNTAEMGTGVEFRPDRSWEGDLLIAGELTEELKKVGYSQSDMADDASIPCVCFWPVN